MGFYEKQVEKLEEKQKATEYERDEGIAQKEQEISKVKAMLKKRKQEVEEAQ